MASFFNMKGTTQPTFTIGTKGPILSKTVINQLTYLGLPTNVLAGTITLDSAAPSTNYIDKTNYTGNAATATKLASANIGLQLSGMTVIHNLPNESENSGLSDGSGKIMGQIVAIDASKLVLGSSFTSGAAEDLSTGAPYAVIANHVVSGDMNGLTAQQSTNKIAAANHTHGQYLSTTDFTIKTKNGSTLLGDIMVDDGTENNTESASITVGENDAKAIYLNLQLRAGSVGETEIASGAVTNEKIGANAVTGAKIHDGVITPDKLKTPTPTSESDPYTGNYKSKIYLVNNAVHLINDNADTITLGGVQLVDILYTNPSTSALTSTVNNAKSAEKADSVSYIEDSTTYSKTAKQVITTVNTVDSASASASAGNLVKWDNDGELNGKAKEAAKLSSTVTLWGHKVNGTSENNHELNVGTTNGAADIEHTGHITPYADALYDLGKNESGTNGLVRRYRNLYLSGTINAAGAATVGSLTTDGTVTARKLYIQKYNSEEANSTNTGIDLGGTTLRNASSVSSSVFAPKEASATVGSSTGTFNAIWGATANSFKWKENGDEVSLGNVLAGKASTTHEHALYTSTNNRIYIDKSQISDNYATVQVRQHNQDAADTITTSSIALSGHTHTLSDISDIAGVYRFKGTIDNTGDNVNWVSVNAETGKLEVTLPEGTVLDNGYVYNVLGSFTYKGEEYPAGTNIVYEKDIPGSGNSLTGEWKPLGGVFDVDLDAFLTGINNGTFTSMSTADAALEANAYSATAGTLAFSGIHRNRHGNANWANNDFSATLPRATNSTFGLIRTGYIASLSPTNRSYPVQMSATGDAYVTVNWTDRDHIDRYHLYTFNSISSADDKIEDGILISSDNRQSVDDTDYNANTVTLALAHDNNDTVEFDKKIQIQANGQLQLEYYNNGNDKQTGTLNFTVPERSGYPIPIIRCVNAPTYEYTHGESETGIHTIIFEAEDDGNYNGIFNSETGRIQDGSLVILFLDRLDYLYRDKVFTEGFMNIKIHMPAPDFIQDAEDDYYSHNSVMFRLVLPSREHYISYFSDLSKKIFLCQISYETASIVPESLADVTISTNEDLIGQRTNKPWDQMMSLHILDDVGDTMSTISYPDVFYNDNKATCSKIGAREFGMRQLDLHVANIMRRYNGIAQLLVRTNILGKYGDYIPIKELDVSLSNNLILIHNNTHLETIFNVDNMQHMYDTYVKLYNKTKLLNNITNNRDEDNEPVNMTLETPAKYIHFKGDRNYRKMSNIRHDGLLKKSGNINLEFLDIDNERRYSQRNYTKLKFQYVLRFNNSKIYDIEGPLSLNEFTVSISPSHSRYGYGAINIKSNK